MSKESKRAQMQVRLIHELGIKMKPGATVLDLGCGNGAVVNEFRRLGYESFGCDFVFKEGPDVQSLHEDHLIRFIEREPYRLPFANDSFDLVLSDQVFEHVKNYDETLAEIRRVLKPGGVSLNFFPSRYTPLEPHVHVPLATIIQARWWLAMWATLGVRTQSQRNMSMREVVEANHVYLTNQTNYLSRSAIARFVSTHFEEHCFCESSFLKVSSRGRIIHKLDRFLLVLNRAYGLLRARVLLFRKGELAGAGATTLLTAHPRVEKSA